MEVKERVVAHHNLIFFIHQSAFAPLGLIGDLHFIRIFLGQGSVRP